MSSAFSAHMEGSYASVVLTTIFFYHSVICLDQEVKFFWPNPRNSASVIYFANRFVGLLVVICNMISRISSWIQALCTLITMLLVEYIMVIRVLALYDQDKKLSMILKSLLFLVAIDGLAFRFRASISEGVVLRAVAQDVYVCGFELKPWPKFSMVAPWLLPMLYGCLVMGLALYKAAEHWRSSHGLKGFSLVRVLFRDQFIYQGAALFYMLSKVLMYTYKVSPTAGIVLGTITSPTLLSIFGGQLLINIKEAGERGENGGLNYSLQRVSDIEFA